MPQIDVAWRRLIGAFGMATMLFALVAEQPVGWVRGLYVLALVAFVWIGTGT